MPANLRYGRFTFLLVVVVLSFHYAADALKAWLVLSPHSFSSRMVDMTLLNAALFLIFVILRDVKQGGHPWLRR